MNTDDFVSPWGKLQKEGKSHHLAHHCADVAACFEAIVAQKVFRARLEEAAGRTLSETDIARLAVLTFLHDIGKLHPGFQAKGWSEESWPRAKYGHKHGHVCEGEAIYGIDDIAKILRAEDLCAWGAAPLMRPAFAHHGRPVRMNDFAEKHWEPIEAENYDPRVAAREIGALLPKWFDAAFTNDDALLPDRPEFQHLFCGLVTLADWLGSTQHIFEFEPRLEDGYMLRVRKKAEKAVDDIGLDVGHMRRAIAGRADFATIADGRTPYDSQKLAVDIPLEERLVILEAETGSGKTEAALWRYARLFEEGCVDGLYFALPTRAAAKQIHSRVHQAAKWLFGDAVPPTVLAVPGYLKAGQVEGKSLPDWRVRWDDEGQQDEAQLQARWAAEHAKRYLAAAIAVGTVDQAMLAALQVKHAHLRAASLARSLLVIDEVHASDRYMTEAIRHLLKMHLDNGGHALLMSATLGSAARVRWLGLSHRTELPLIAEAVAAPYPAAWSPSMKKAVAGSGGAREKSVAISMEEQWSPEHVAGHAVAAAKKGARVLVIRNTVGAAIKTFAAVREIGGDSLLWQVAGGPALHHGRFAVEDRRLLDENVERALPPRSRPASGLIVIGTQTLEQSLDIDADFLVADLCPMDVLLQRIGRLHRHALERPPGFEEPRCVVMTPQNGLAWLTASGAFENGLGRFKDGGGVYVNLHACELTCRLIRKHPVWNIPAMNRQLVEEATHEERVTALNEELGEAWEKYWAGTCGNEIAEASAARQIVLRVGEPFGEALFVSDDSKVRTRLGAAGSQIKFPKSTVGPFGEIITEITLPARWSRGVETAEPENVRQEQEGEVRFSVNSVEYAYNRLGLDRVP